MRDRGSMVVSVGLVLIALSVIVLGGVVSFVGELGARGRAQLAADASALAGVVGGRSAAIVLAEDNDGRLVSWSVDRRDVGVVVRVVVEVDGVQATARATDRP